MNHTPLEDQVHDTLHRTADPLERAPFTVADVRTRARRIQRRRAAVAGAAVAAVVALVVPVGLGMVGPAQRSEVPPATRPPSPDPTPAVTGTVLIDPRSAEVVDSTSVPLVDVDAPSLITPDGTVTLPGPFSTITPYLDGWVGVTMDEGRGTLEFLDANLDVDDSSGPTGGLVVSPDGEQIAWSEYTGDRWRVVLADPAGDAEWVYTNFPLAPADHIVMPIGFVSEGEVVVRQYDNALPTRTYVAGGDEPVEVPGLLQPEASSPVTGAIAGPTEYGPDGTCSGVVDGLARSGTPVWTTCEHRLGPFSPDGAHVVGTDAEADATGSPTLAVLDAATGEVIVDFEVAAAPRQVVAIWSQMAWEDEDTLVIRVLRGEEFFIVRVGLDGSVQRVGIPSAGASGLAVAAPS